MDLGLSGKVALVTGSHRGTGQVIAERLASEGATVIAHGLDEGSADHVAEGSKVEYAVWGDIRNEAGSEIAAKQALAVSGRVDILINNYGMAENGSWTSASTHDWLSMYQVNVLSAVRMVGLLKDAMIDAGGGRIIQLGTIGSTQPNAQRPHYYAAKGALANVTVSLAKELAGTGITVNTVSPGFIRTPEVEAGFRAKAKRKGWGESWYEIEAHIVAERFPNPVGRIATREEVADLVCFLSSVRAGFINGQNIRVDGGAIDIVH
ncbi:MAG TPA: 3-oxoacyl-ACP reductase [Porticoccaceae bacterium]|nr:3-oxoacyl-ACP reductase [Porticoccaceae bacterium]